MRLEGEENLGEIREIREMEWTGVIPVSNNRLRGEWHQRRESGRGIPGNDDGDKAVDDLRTLMRGRGGPRIRCVQGRLSKMFDEDEAPGAVAGASGPGADRSRTAVVAHPRHGASAGPPPVSHPPAYRGVLATWPEHWRERW